MADEMIIKELTRLSDATEKLVDDMTDVKVDIGKIKVMMPSLNSQSPKKQRIKDSAAGGGIVGAVLTLAYAVVEFFKNN